MDNPSKAGSKLSKNRSASPKMSKSPRISPQPGTSETSTEVNQAEGQLDLTSKLKGDDGSKPRRASENMFTQAFSSGATAATTKHTKSELKEMVSKDSKYAKYFETDELNAPKIKKHRRLKLEDNQGPTTRRESRDFRDKAWKNDPFARYRIPTATDRRHRSAPPGRSTKFADSSDESVARLDYEKHNLPFYDELAYLNQPEYIPPESPYNVPRRPPPSQRLAKKLSDASILKQIFSRRSSKKHMQVRLTKERAKRLFGNNSKLAECRFQLVLRMIRESTEEEHSGSLDSGISNCADLSWIQEYSDADFIEHPDFSHMPLSTRKRATSKLFSALAPLWYGMVITGRMPFCGGVNQKTGLLKIELRRTSCRFITFCLTSFLIFVVMMLSVLATLMSYDEFASGTEKDKRRELLPNQTEKDRNNTVHPYTQLEILHLEKHWLPYTLLMLHFLFATCCNLLIIINGRNVARLINTIINTCVNFQMDGAKWIWAACLTGQLLMAGVGFFKAAMCIWQFSDYESEVNGYLTMTTTRLFFSYIRTHLDIFAIVAPFFFLIQLYATYAAVVHIILPTVLVIAMDNIATHWNFRLGLVLGKIKVTSNKLRWIKRQLNYEYMFECHIKIRKMIKQYSLNAFAGLLVTWYCLMVIGICCILFRVARAAGIDFAHNATSLPELPDTSVEHVNIRYTVPPLSTFLDSATFMLSIATGLFLVTDVIGRIGRSIMEKGFSFIRRHGMMGCKSAQERRFILSLYQSFSSRQPCVITPGNWFRIDRRLIIAIIEVIMLVFTTMIQARKNVLIEHEILGLCDTGVCVIGYARVNGRGRPLLNQNIQAVFTVNKPGQPDHVIIKPPVITDPIKATTVETTLVEPIIPTSTTTEEPVPPGPGVTSTTTEEPPPPGTASTTTEEPMISTTEEPGPPPPGTPDKPPPILDKNLNKRLYGRCPETDISRQIIYTKNKDTSYSRVELPTDKTECLTTYYRSLESSGKKYYNALGNQLDFTKMDDCGILLLPNLKYVDASLLTDTSDISDKAYPDSITEVISTKEATYSCRVHEVDPEDLLNPGRVKKINGIQPPRFSICGMPPLPVDIYCRAAKLAQPASITKASVDNFFNTVISSFVNVESNRPVICSADSYVLDLQRLYKFDLAKLGLITTTSFVFDSEISEMEKESPKPISWLWLREPLRYLRRSTANSASKPANDWEWDFIPFRMSRKTVILPYGTVDTAVIDCAGNIMKEKDDCGLYPVSVISKGNFVKPLKDVVVTYDGKDASGNLVSKTRACWQHIRSDFQCGMDTALPDHKTKEVQAAYYDLVCDTFQKFKAGTLTFEEFITED